MIDDAFMVAFKLRTEAKWQEIELEEDISGYQIQKGTMWLPGLTPTQISQYEKDLDCCFPDDFRMMLKHVNGFDTPGLNIYANTGEPHRTRPLTYSYPGDMEVAQSELNHLKKDWKEVAPLIEKALGIKMGPSVRFVPINRGNLLVCSSDPKASPVVFVDEGFVAKQGDNLRDFLQKEFLEELLD